MHVVTLEVPPAQVFDMLRSERRPTDRAAFIAPAAVEHALLGATLSWGRDESVRRFHYVFESPASFAFAADPRFARYRIVERTIDEPPAFDRPVVILSPNRAGSTLLFETLGRAEPLWSLGSETQIVTDSLPSLRLEHRGWSSHRLLPEDADPRTASQIRWGLFAGARDRDGRFLIDERPARIRFLEKAPRTSLRVGFMRALFPDARFIVLVRDPLETIGSIMEAWTTEARVNGGGFVSIPALPGWDRGAWRMILPPGWQRLAGAPLAAIAAAQWQAAYEHILDDLDDGAAWCAVHFRDLVRDPAATVRALCDFAELPIDDRMAAELAQPLPLSRTTLSPPSRDKARARYAEIAPFLPALAPTVARMRARLGVDIDLEAA